jgi:hypothetical protein
VGECLARTVAPAPLLSWQGAIVAFAVSLLIAARGIRRRSGGSVGP